MTTKRARNASSAMMDAVRLPRTMPDMRRKESRTVAMTVTAPEYPSLPISPGQNGRESTAFLRRYAISGYTITVQNARIHASALARW